MSPNRQSMKKYSQDELAVFLRYSGVFSACDQAEIDYILSQIKTYHYKNATSLDGKEVRFPPIGPHRWMGWMSCFDSQALSHDWVATAKSDVIVIPGAVIRKLCENNPDLYPRVMAEINRQFKLLMNWTEFVSLHSLNARVRMLINILSQISATPMDDKPGWLQVDVTQEHLASFLNLSRQTANKLLVKLEKDDYISIGYRKILINADKLPNLTS